MKQYYYAIDEKQFGPFTIEELKSKHIKKTTLVWTNGMNDWELAESIEELKEIILNEPPPLPRKALPPVINAINLKRSISEPTSTKYDITYNKEIRATVVGILLLAFSLFMNLSESAAKMLYEIFSDQTSFITGFFSLVIRILVTIWVINIAKRQNRDANLWGILAFFFPSIILIIIGMLNKLRLRIDLDESLPVKKQVAILMNKVRQFYPENRYEECVEILNKIIELDENNVYAIKARALSYYYMNNFEKSSIDFEFLHSIDKFPDITYYYLGNIAIKHFRQSEAISYWLKAKENSNIYADKQLDLYYNYTGKYNLSYAQSKKKINSEYVLVQAQGFKNDLIYKGGINQISIDEKLINQKCDINIFNFGLDVIFDKIFKVTHLTFAYYEIEAIKLNKEGQFKLILISKEEVLFSFDPRKCEYFIDQLNYILDLHKLRTGKTLTKVEC